jgi:hypothetical protein
MSSTQEGKRCKARGAESLRLKAKRGRLGAEGPGLFGRASSVLKAKRPSAGTAIVPIEGLPDYLPCGLRAIKKVTS